MAARCYKNRTIAVYSKSNRTAQRDDATGLPHEMGTKAMLEGVKTALRTYAPGVAYSLKTFLKGAPGSSQSPAAVFGQIYANGVWGDGDEPYSGSGSDDAISAPYVKAVRQFILQKKIRSVVDLGCGDFRVGSKFLDLEVDYTGVDVVPALIERNAAKFGSEHVRFACLDITKDELPAADLCVVRQVLQHLSNAQIARVLGQLAPFKYVLIAEHHPARLMKPNLDKDTGADTRIDFDSGVYLEHPPFNVPNTSILTTTTLPPLLRAGEHLTVYLIERTAGP